MKHPQSAVADEMALKFSELLDSWYVQMKPKLKGQAHNLGFEKEEVKLKCCDLLIELVDRYEDLSEGNR